VKVCARDTAPSRGRAGAPVSRLERASLPNDSFSVRRVEQTSERRTLLADSYLLAVSYLPCRHLPQLAGLAKNDDILAHVTFVG